MSKSSTFRINNKQISMHVANYSKFVVFNNHNTQTNHQDHQPKAIMAKAMVIKSKHRTMCVMMVNITPLKTNEQTSMSQ
jgi:hypothetical protein